MFRAKNREEEEDVEVDDNVKPTLKRNESEWINTVLKKGTISDKLAAHTILIHESRNWASLASLIDMVDPRKCRRQCVMAMNTLKELFLDSLNISRKNSPIKTEEERQKVKFYYSKFIDNLHLVAFDSLEETRRKAIWVLSALLMKHGENKEYILEKLVDKIGDKVPKLASAAADLITKAINSERHDLRGKAVKYIERFLKKPKLEPRAKFYAIALLSHIKLYRDQYEIANNMIQIYLDLFKKMVDDGDFESRLMSTIFIGLHRVYPYSKLGNEVFEQHLQTLYTLVHHVSYKEGILALVLIKNIVTKRAKILKCPVDDRYYNVLFKQLLRSELQRCSRMEQFCELLLSLINEDPILERKVAFVKRMLQVAVHSRPHLTYILLYSITKINGFSTLFSTEDDNDNDNNGEDEVSSEEKQKFNASENEDDDDNDEDEETAVDVASSWVHIKKKARCDNYDPFARNPRFANAKKARLNELYLLRSHYDPEIAKLAQQVIDGKSPQERLSEEQFSYVSCMNKFLLKSNKNNSNDNKDDITKIKSNGNLISSINNNSTNNKDADDDEESGSKWKVTTIKGGTKKRKKNRRLTKSKKRRLASLNEKQRNGNK